MSDVLAHWVPSCPACGGRSWLSDFRQGKVACTGCGLVLTQKEMEQRYSTAQRSAREKP